MVKVNELEQTTQIRIAGIVRNSIVDGPGIRYTVFGQGCPLKCEDCHNPQTHDSKGGSLIDIAAIADEVKKDPLLDGITFTGGEPFVQPLQFAALAELLKSQDKPSSFNIICYTGYSFEELYQSSDSHILLERVDILIDGRFDRKRKSFGRHFKGSENQRTLDSKESVRRGKAIEIHL